MARSEQISNSREFLRVEEVAAVLGVDRHTVYRRIRAGDLPAIRLGRLWLFPRGAIEAYKGIGRKDSEALSLREAARRSAELLRGHESDLATMFESLVAARSQTSFADPLA